MQDAKRPSPLGQGRWLPAMVLVLWVAVASFWVTEQVNRQEEQASFASLAEKRTSWPAASRSGWTATGRSLTLLAEILAMGRGGPDGISGAVSGHRQLLFPAGTAAARGPGGHPADGEEVSAAGRLSFAQEAARGAHVTDRETDLDGQSPVVRHYVPVVRQGQTAALLCGVIELRSLAAGTALPALRRPDGGLSHRRRDRRLSGGYLAHRPAAGNIWALGSRPMAEGYNDASCARAL